MSVRELPQALEGCDKDRATALACELAGKGARLVMQVRRAAARQGLTRGQANEIANQILAKYERQAADAPIGSEYQDCYHAATALPTQEHLDMYRRVKDDLASLGIQFPY
jgi:methylamine--corrinoid protein Co-methyltransferase